MSFNRKNSQSLIKEQLKNAFSLNDGRRTETASLIIGTSDEKDIMKDRKELEHNFLYIEFNNSEEYHFGKLQIASNLDGGIYKEVREIEYKKPLKELLNFSDDELRIYIDLSFYDFIDSISRYSKKDITSAEEFSFSYRSKKDNYKEADIHLTDSYKQQDSEIYNKYINTLKIKEFYKNINEFQNYKSSLEYVLFKSEINKADLFNSQIILIKDYHDKVYSKDWIINHLTTDYAHDAICLLEFLLGKNNEEVKMELEGEFSKTFTKNFPDTYNIHCNTIKHLDKVSMKLIGGETENTINLYVYIPSGCFQLTGIENDAINRRMMCLDYVFYKKIEDILIHNPNQKIVIWVGGGHADGIIENVLTKFNVTNAIVSPYENKVEVHSINLVPKLTLGDPTMNTMTTMKLNRV